jgi:hypothetical protein
MKAALLISFLSLIFLAFPLHAQNGSVTIPSSDSSTTAPSTGTTVGSSSHWAVKDIEALSLVSHNFATGVTASGPTLGVGIAAEYSGYSVPLGGALVVNYNIATSGSPNLFGLGALIQCSHLVIGPEILWVDKQSQWLLNFGGSTSLF